MACQFVTASSETAIAVYHFFLLLFKLFYYIFDLVFIWLFYFIFPDFEPQNKCHDYALVTLWIASQLICIPSVVVS